MNEMEKKTLYDKAKEAYYNGEEIMSDVEFDELENELGLENKGYIGSTSKHYTVKHPYIMGSISKVQVKYNDNGEIDYKKYIEEIKKFLKKSSGYGRNDWMFEVTPKLDGCSFECVADHKGELISVSTRGDGEWGKDIKDWFIVEWEKNYKPRMTNWIQLLDEDSYMFIDKFVIRGEVLVDKRIFEEKYSKDFTIPRSFVSGVINQDWEGTPKQIEMRNDLSFIAYDYREVYDNGAILEVDYNESFPGVVIEERNKLHKSFINKFENIYKGYDDYRNYKCRFCLDGFVIKPAVNFRLQDNSRERQEDCVAIKFTPEVAETQILKIEWSVGKTGEYFPTAVVKEVIIGGKKVNRVSLHNYDYIVRNGCWDGGNDTEGAKIQVVLSGDIIPHILKILKPCEPLVLSIPSDSYITKDETSGCLHCMKKMTEYDLMFNNFLTSVRVFNIDGVGEKIAEKLFTNVMNVSNIILLMSEPNLKLIEKTLGTSKSTSNIITALREKREKLTMAEVIESCGYDDCGPKNSLFLAKVLSGLTVDTFGIPQSIIELVDNEDFVKKVRYYCNMFNVPYTKVDVSDNKIPIIMTGEPSNTQYKTKKLWLNAHPQYVETSSWKEVKILFTNDLSATSSKMIKANKKGVEIRLY